MIFAPMMREGKVIGAVGTARPSSERFDDRQVALIETFANQAVIAIENARLFNELRESLQQQTVPPTCSHQPLDIRFAGGVRYFDRIRCSPARGRNGGYRSSQSWDLQLRRVTVLRPPGIRPRNLAVGRTRFAWARCFRAASLIFLMFSLIPNTPSSKVRNGAGTELYLVVLALREGDPIGVIFCRGARYAPSQTSKSSWSVLSPTKR